MPLLGTGYAGMEPKVCYDTIVEYIGRELDFGLTPVATIRLVIQDGVII